MSITLRATLGLAAALALPAPPASAWSPPKRAEDAKLRGCPELGQGYVRVPGTDTCVRLGGLVRVEAARQGGSR